jgi:hypothetical protein
MNKSHFFLLPLVVLFIACSGTVPGLRDLTNTPFPQVQGTSLEEESVTIPDAYSGEPTLFLVGYKQRAQFDIDRWILGVLQAQIKIRIIELPTIAGMMPRIIKDYINQGMRGGIPNSDWGSVVTVYEDAQKIINVLGNQRPQNCYAVLVDKNGIIVWSSNKGYSASQVLELKTITENL